MRIGTDFDKIEFEFWGLDLLEPNALIGDTLIAILSLYFGYKTFRLTPTNQFFHYWTIFFVLFGFGFFAGGLGHTFYNYWGVSGKYFSWFGSIISLYFLEKALISVDTNRKKVKFFNLIALFKLVACLAVEVFIVSTVDLEKDPQLGLLMPSIATLISMILFNGYLGFKYKSLLSKSFHYLLISIAVMIPAAIVQALRINIHPLLDRNDLGHICVIVMLILYWKTISGYRETLNYR